MKFTVSHLRQTLELLEDEGLGDSVVHVSVKETYPDFQYVSGLHTSRAGYEGEVIMDVDAEFDVVNLVSEPARQRDPGSGLHTELYVDGTGKHIEVHEKTALCAISCVIHNPSDHPMKDFPTYWRHDRQLMERICPHGVGHPDPDHIAHVARTFGKKAAILDANHGCDGCCGG